MSFTEVLCPLGEHLSVSPSTAPAPRATRGSPKNVPRASPDLRGVRHLFDELLGLTENLGDRRDKVAVRQRPLLRYETHHPEVSKGAHERFAIAPRLVRPEVARKMSDLERQGDDWNERLELITHLPGATVSS